MHIQIKFLNLLVISSISGMLVVSDPSDLTGGIISRVLTGSSGWLTA